MRRKRIYQLFCGRTAAANLIEHRKAVFANLHHYPWQALKSLGFNAVYLLGVWDNRGPIVVNEEAGEDISNHPHRYPSPFAVANHLLPNPDLGSVEDFKSLIEKIHQENLEVFVDFVPNHTSIAHPWAKLHPEYYKSINNATFSGDVIDLDYSKSEVGQEMFRVIQNICSYQIDGIRVDMAHLIPIDFWRTSISKVKSTFPTIKFLAEAYSSSVFDLSIQQSLFDSGFDSVYDEPLYRNIKLSAGEALAINIAAHGGYIAACASAQKWCHYIENHDDSFAQNKALLTPLLAVSMGLPGWNLVYNGALLGKNSRLAHHWIELLPAEYESFDRIDKQLLSLLSWLSQADPTLDAIASQGHQLKLSFNNQSHQLTVDVVSGSWNFM